MSGQDLLAPPKLTTKRYGWIVGVTTAIIICIGVLLAIVGVLTAREAALKSLVIGVFAAGVVWLYSRLMRVARVARPERMPLIHAVSGLAGIVPLYVWITLLLSGTALESATQSYVAMLPLMFGFMLAGLGFARRMGDSMHCPQCEYEFKFDQPEDAPIRCPECGTGWLGRLKKGRRVRSPRLIGMGVAIGVLGSIALNPIFYMGFLAPHLPTPMLVGSLYVAPSNAYAVWDEMLNRSLSPRWTWVVAERVLRRRGMNPYDNGGSRWFEAMNGKGKIPPELRERFFVEGFEAELVAPSRVKVGEQIPVKLRVSRDVDGWGTKLGLMFGGYTIGEDSAPVGRLDKTLWGHEVRPSTFRRYNDVCAQTLRADRLGDLRVRVVYWIAYLPSFTEALKWQEDGTPEPPGVALWFRRFETEKTVRVE